VNQLGMFAQHHDAATGQTTTRVVDDRPVLAGAMRLEQAEAALRVTVEDDIGKSLLLDRFFQFHHENPAVFPLLLRFAREVRHRRQFGVAAIYERVRWEIAMTTAEDTGLKLNNNHRAYYARLLSLFDPSLAGLFATRALGPHREVQIV
jgi:hypothetical protein